MSADKQANLLIVDTSPSYALVLKDLAAKYGYNADVFTDPQNACDALDKRDYDYVLLGWPEGKLNIIAGLLGKLAASANAQLPLMVFSAKKHNDVESFVQHRAHTRAVLWKDHLQAVNMIDKAVYPVGFDREAMARAKAANQKRILLVDDTPSIVHTLRAALSDMDYNVSVAKDLQGASSAVTNKNFHLIVANYFVQDDNGKNFCHHLQTMDMQDKPVYAVMSHQNLENIVKQSVGFGASACLDKRESTEMLAARIDALAGGAVLTPAQRVEITDQPQAPEVAPVVTNSTSAAPVAPLSVAVAAGVVANEVVEKEVVVRVNQILSRGQIQQQLERLLSSNSQVPYLSMLMIDVKLQARVTADRLSLGSSEPMLQIVKDKLARVYTRENSLGYIGGGRFVFLFATQSEAKALQRSRKLAEVIPSIVHDLANVDLVSHGAFMPLPNDTSMNALHLLEYCSAACIKAEEEQRDHSIYVIHKSQYLRTKTRAQLQAPSV